MGANRNLAPVLEWISASFGAGVCLMVVVTFGALQADELWPLPGLYFAEIVLLAAAVILSLALDRGTRLASRSLVPWLAGGVLLAFVVLGGFSIGPYLFPAMLAFWLVGLLADLRTSRKIAIHLALALIAGLLQGGLMLVIISIVH